MIKKTIYIFLMLAVVFISKNTFAADGYESFEFGMSTEKVRRKLQQTGYDIAGNAVYDFEEVGGDEPDTKSFKCNSLLVAGKKCTAFFFFTNNKLDHIAINVSSSDLKEKIEILSLLIKKYGTPHIIPFQPKQANFCFFDNNTIVLIYNNEGNLLRLEYSADPLM